MLYANDATTIAVLTVFIVPLSTDLSWSTHGVFVTFLGLEMDDPGLLGLAQSPPYARMAA
jgi:hypothetical protein